MDTRISRKPKKSPARNVLHAIGRVFLTLFLIGLVTATICGIVFAVYVATSIDAKIDLGVETMALNYTSTLYYYDEDGNPKELERLYSGQNREWADLEEMPHYLKDAAISIEDERFETHHGVDFKRTLGAAANMFLQIRSDFGGSTITQQLVKNLTGDRQDTVRRKIQEIMRAFYIERNFSKDTIIELYLNTIYLAEGCYGVRSAAEVYFNKDVSQLTLAECAAIVGITNLPTYYDPLINPENNKARQEQILAKMLELGRISQAEYDEAMKQKLVFVKTKRQQQLTHVQSYFVDQVINEVIHDLMESFGYSYQVAEQMIYSGGLQIYTTIDNKVQKSMESVFENPKNFPTYSTKAQPECAMVVMDPYSGDVLGLVGGRGKKTQNRILNRATMTYRQPGSSIKPIAVYAPAIEYGLINPQSTEDDAPMMEYNGKPYPLNETRKYQGRMNVTKALMESVNAVAMRTLDQLTPARSYEFLTKNLGITSLNPVSDVHLAPLSLGALTKGVSVMELTAAYAAFPNMGTYLEPRTYSKVLNSQGKVLMQKDQDVVQAMSEKTATYMNYMLGRVIGTGGTGVKAKLNNNMPAAGKTGTTDDDKDRWFVGYTPYYVGGVWFGYDTPRYIRTTLSPALTVWKKVMNEIHEGLPRKEFEVADGFEKVAVCACSGKLATKLCKADPRGSQVIEGYFYKDDVPTEYCDVHVSVRVCAISGMRAGDFCPSTKFAALLQLDRYSPVKGVVLGDEQYVIRPSGSELPEGMFYYYSNGARRGARCTLHTQAVPEVPEPPATGQAPTTPEGGEETEPSPAETPPITEESPAA